MVRQIRRPITAERRGHPVITALISSLVLAGPALFGSFDQDSQLTPIAQAAIIGKDERKKLPPQYMAAASGIGILGQPGKRSWSCTAFCVTPNMIATNAHCIVKNQTVGRRLDLSRTIFMLPSLQNQKTKKFYPNRYGYLQYVAPKTPGLSIYSGHYRTHRSVRSQSQDWAFTKLKNNACAGRTLGFAHLSIKELQKAAQQNRLLMIGYHGDDKMQARLLSTNCRVRSPHNRKYFLKAQRRQMAKNKDLLPHTCDAFKGSSGSPILLKTATGLKVVGINLGSLRYERYQIRKNRYTGKVISRKKLRQTRETNMAVRPKAFLTGLERFHAEQILISPSQLGLIQTLLKELKLYKGRIDSTWGPASKRAVLAYEKQNNLAPLGLPTRELLKHLWQKIDQLKKQSNNET